MIKLTYNKISSLLIGCLTIFPLTANAQMAVFDGENIKALEQIQNEIQNTNIILILGFAIIAVLLIVLIQKNNK